MDNFAIPPSGQEIADVINNSPAGDPLEKCLVAVISYPASDKTISERVSASLPVNGVASLWDGCVLINFNN